jgi:tetratricopeptide (TPR) repeat protein
LQQSAIDNRGKIFNTDLAWNDMIKAIETIKKYLLYTLVVLYPVFVFSFASATYTLPKTILLSVVVGLAIILWMVESVIKGSVSFKAGKFDIPILLVATSYIASGFLATPNKMEAFFFPGAATIVGASALLYFLINQLKAEDKEGISFAVVISGVLLSVVVLFAQIGVLTKIPQLPAFVKDVTFNPMGGSLPAVVYMLAALTIAALFIFKQKDNVYKLFAGVSAGVIILGMIILGKNILPGQPQSPKLPDLNTSWQIAVDTLKVSPIWGVGPGNYLTAFNRFRPVSYNASDLWQVRFTTATNYYMTAISELGFAGILAFAVLFIVLYKFVSRKFDIKFLPAIITLVLFAIFPIAPALITILFVLLAIISESENKNVNLLAESSSKSAVVLICLPFAVALGVFFFVASGWIRAEANYTKALEALAKNDAKTTYDAIVAAVKQNPTVDRYHASLAQIDMALAQSLASKTEVTDTDKETITQLVQEAINEGKATVTLNPARSGNWEILAQIYRSIMPFATGADQFAIQTYNQAVALDPTNPSLRISLGGVYYALGRYDDAIDTFKLAVLAKSNLANAHYNLAIAYQAKKDYDNAITSINNVISLVPNDSEDYKLAKSTLDELNKNKPAKTSEETDNLQAPQAIEPSNVKPPIELPEEATPPAATQ